MSASPLLVVLILSAASLAAQEQAPVTTPQISSGELSLTYTLPAEWEPAEMRPFALSAQQNTPRAAATGCLRMARTAPRGDLRSVVLIIGLPVNCMGGAYYKNELPDFANGAARGIAKGLNVSEPTFAVFRSSGYLLWIERASATPAGQPATTQYTLETVCGNLDKGPVCWTVRAADDHALQAFENGAIALDGEVGIKLVPANAFEFPVSSFESEPPRELNEADYVTELINQLSAADWHIRANAAAALGKIGAPRSVDPLIAALKDRDWNVRD